ncbi:hypothetical protein P170DRAFT_237116 [Aspergillus steynii IBT 23096]|uniref:Uncharacterized protein n=1 Tax=Aspergillus steynii IBT 23096 TaxID=1392250 RepID=A0A2I2G2Z0_9EURO|nr:uncharacterized protein P170DRAFT_237116 [Aspergillus steynii IBT 23096]PLB47239.1 hypothetical protein P170DRAFT_237116 [Aspergillus steynii IBT 23096]
MLFFKPAIAPSFCRVLSFSCVLSPITEWIWSWGNIIEFPMEGKAPSHRGASSLPRICYDITHHFSTCAMPAESPISKVLW